MLDREPLTLRSNFSWTFAGNVFYAAAQWGMLTCLAKMGTPEMVGQFALGLAVTAPVIMFTNLNLRAVQATDAKHQYRFGDYLALRLIATTLALMVISGIVLVAGYRRETALVILFVGLAKAFESVSDVFYGLLQQYERMDRIAKSMIIKGSLSLIALSIGIYVTGSVVWGVVGLGLVWASILLGYDIRSGTLILQASPQTVPDLTPRQARPTSRVRPHWAVETLGELALLALPLGLVMMLISLNNNIPRYFIEQYLGERELGIFAAMAYVTVAGVTVVTALGQAASPRLARYYAARSGTEFCTLLLKLVGIGALLGAVGLLLALVAGQEVLTLLYGPEYAKHVDVFVWLTVAAGITYVAAFLGYGMTAARRFGLQAPLFILVGCSCAATCFWLVPATGLNGAAIALIVGAAVQLVGGLAVIAYALRALYHREGEEMRA